MGETLRANSAIEHNNIREQQTRLAQNVVIRYCVQDGPTLSAMKHTMASKFKQ